jgi:hypothetical protein
MANRGEKGYGSESEKQKSTSKPNTSDEIPILDHLVLDFVDEPIAARKNEHWRVVAEAE